MEAALFAEHVPCAYRQSTHELPDAMHADEEESLLHTLVALVVSSASSSASSTRRTHARAMPRFAPASAPIGAAAAELATHAPRTNQNQASGYTRRWVDRRGRGELVLPVLRRPAFATLNCTARLGDCRLRVLPVLLRLALRARDATHRTGSAAHSAASARSTLSATPGAQCRVLARRQQA